MNASRFFLFTSKFTVGDGCWNWHAGGDRYGYGHFANGGETKLAHRISYELLKGPLDSSLVLDHLCGNPGCVNPAHLEQVTQGTNAARGKGLEIAIERKKNKKYCTNNHPLFGENLYEYKGSRACKTCRREAVRKMRKRND